MPETNPIAAGLLKHSSLWLRSGCQQTVYPSLSVDPNLNPDDAIAVYCIHGTGDKAGILSDLAHRLALGALPSNVSKLVLAEFDARAAITSVEFYAEQLADQIRANNDRQVIIFGHSRGGLIAAEFAQNLAERQGITVQGVVAACSPFGGTDLAIFPVNLLSTSIAQMQTGSAYLNQLNAGIQINPKTRFRYYSASSDWVVRRSATVVANQGEPFELDDNLHHTIVVDPRLVEGTDSLPGLRACITEWAQNPLPRRGSVPESSVIPRAGETFYANEGYSSEEQAVLQRLEHNFRHNETLSFYSNPVSLLDILEAAARDYAPNSPLHQTGLNVLAEARKLLPLANRFIDLKKWKISVMLAISVLNDPQDADAVTLLHQDATRHALGHAKGWKQWGGALALLAAVAIVGLTLLRIPFSGGFSLIAGCVIGGLVAAGGAALIYSGRQTGLSLPLSQLEAEVRDYRPG